MRSPGGERGAILSGGAPGPARPGTPRRTGPRSRVDTWELSAVDGMTLREAARALDCTTGAIQLAGARVVHGRIEVGS